MAAPRTYAYRAVGHPRVHSQCQARLTQVARGLLAQSGGSAQRCGLEKEHRGFSARSRRLQEAGGRGERRETLCADSAWRWTNVTARSAAGCRSQLISSRTVGDADEDAGRVEVSQIGRA